MSTLEFEIVTLRQTHPPTPDHKGSWYQYTIANRISEITGTRCGTKDEVMAFVKASLHRLNNRHKSASFTKG